MEAKWDEKKSILDQELAKVELMLANTFDRYVCEWGEGERGRFLRGGKENKILRGE